MKIKLLLLCLLVTISLNAKEWRYGNLIEGTLGGGNSFIFRGDLLPITFGWGGKGKYEPGFGVGASVASAIASITGSRWADGFGSLNCRFMLPLEGTTKVDDVYWPYRYQKVFHVTISGCGWGQGKYIGVYSGLDFGGKDAKQGAMGVEAGIFYVSRGDDSGPLFYIGLRGSWEDPWKVKKY